jgi:ribosomal protein S6E (S10)
MSEHVSGMDVRGNMQEHIVVEPNENETLEELATRMIAAVKENSFVSARFDGVEIVIGGGNDADEIITKFNLAKGRGLTSTEQL